MRSRNDGRRKGRGRIRRLRWRRRLVVSRKRRRLQLKKEKRNVEVRDAEGGQNFVTSVF